MEHKWPVIEQQKLLALKDLEIMRLREALKEIERYGDCKVCYAESTKALSNPTTYDDLIAWHNEQLGETVYVSHYSEEQEQVEGGCTVPVTLRKDK